MDVKSFNSKAIDSNFEIVKIRDQVLEERYSKWKKQSLKIYHKKKKHLFIVLGIMGWFVKKWK